MGWLQILIVYFFDNVTSQTKSPLCIISVNVEWFLNVFYNLYFSRPLCCDYLTVFLLNEKLSRVCSLSTNPSWPYKDESQGQIAISLKRAWNRYKQQSAKVWPWIVQAIDWWINNLNYFSWARLHLGSIKHSSIFSPCLYWWQWLIRKHLSTLSQLPWAIVNVNILWELLPHRFLGIFLPVCFKWRSLTG